MTFNPGQRVQAYTHPLWAFIHIPFRLIVKNMYLLGLFISMATTIAAVLLLLNRTAKTSETRIFLLVSLISSAAFMDYSTSGLENPLTHLLLILFAILGFSERPPRQKLWFTSLIAGLMLLNRMDSILLVAPMLAYIWWNQRSVKTALIVLAGITPFLLWEVVATIYYGFPFPNTAYAKLNTHLGRGELLQQGMYYVADVFREDPITPLLILAGTALPFIFKQKKYYAFSLGMILYLLYILYIGGDFMRGRFFTAPMVGALILLTMLVPARWALYAAPVAVVLGFLGSSPPVLSHSQQGKAQTQEAFIGRHGIANERAYYFPATGLIAAQGRKLPDHEKVKLGQMIRKDPRNLFLAYNMGFMGYFAGPDNHILDRYALTDPFLAQLPNVYRPDWRPGHNQRLIPRHYIQSLETGENRLLNPELQQLYFAINQLTRGPVWNGERFKTIWKMNFTDYHSKLVDRSFYTLPKVIIFEENELEQVNQQTLVTHADAGFEIALSPPRPIKQVELQLQRDCEYICVFMSRDKVVKGEIVYPTSVEKVLARVVIKGPPETINRIVLYPSTASYPCQVRVSQLSE